MRLSDKEADFSCNIAGWEHLYMQRTNLTGSVLTELESMITGNMKPGEKMPTEKDLSERFSVGRSTIRESMMVLVAKGLVTRTTEGTFVSDQVNKCLVDPLNLLVNMEVGNVRDLLELRKIVELGAIRLAAQKITDEQLLQLKKLNWQMQEPGISAVDLQERDIDFHYTIAEATGNQLLAEFVHAIRMVIVKNIENDAVPFGFVQEACMLHQMLIEDMEAHDADHAYATLEHYFSFNEDLGAYNR